MLNKKDLSERDISTKFIFPALIKAGWENLIQIREEVPLTDGRIYVNKRLVSRGSKKYADYVLYLKPNQPLAVIEAKKNTLTLGDGMQQALNYADLLDVPFAFSSNGDGFLFHDRTVSDGQIETELSLDEFPSPQVLWEKYKRFKGYTDEQEKIVTQEYFFDGSGRTPRYYQQVAINRTMEAIAKGQDRIMLVMATGTGKTYTAFQIAYRLWKARAKKRILFLADRTALIDQTRRGDFKHFKDAMTIIKKKVVQRSDGKEELISTQKRGIDSADKAYEIFLGLYQGLSSSDPEMQDAYKDFSPDFFDLIIIDECHRGSAREDSAWREILDYFKNATHIGLTATPRETEEASNSEYFGDPIYTYSLRQGIEDGFLAPYNVIRVTLDVDAEGWRPEQGKTDKSGQEVEDRVYNRKDFDRNLVIDERTEVVAAKLTEFLKGYDRFAKAIVFCVDIDHAERMRSALANQNADLVAKNHKYVMRITGDNEEGKRELDNFINPEETYPVIATTSELMTTGVDAQTCQVIVLDTNISSMTKFKQIIGRGTRINEEYGKMYFTILDFRNATDLFADPDFDGDPIRVKPVSVDTDIAGIIDEQEENEEPIIDSVTGEEIIFTHPGEDSYSEGVPGTVVGDPPPEPREKIYVNNVDVSVLHTRTMYFDQHGKPVTTSLKDHTREIIRGQYASLDDFLNKWKSSDRKEAIIEELKEQGILVDALYGAVNRELDLFDLICHVAYDQPPLTRKERAENVKKRNYFAKYGEQARKVLEALLDKYADQGIQNIEDSQILTIPPINEFGTVVEIINAFGSKKEYDKAIREMSEELYNVA